jgi:uncharacterized small protein (DUF1192 family)
LNYNLAPERDGGQLSFISKRTGEVKCHNRADVNVMCSWVVTAPKDLAGAEYGLFFREAYAFLNQRYADGGTQNVISAYVHMDESTPHLHYAFVPVVHDKKKGIDKVSAKIAIDRLDLQTFHQDLEQHMATVFGREIGILNEATKDGNKSIDELKRGTAQTELSTLHGDITASRNILADVSSNTSVAEIEQREHEKLQAEVERLRDEKTALDKELSTKRATAKKLATQIKEFSSHVDGRFNGAVRDFEDVIRDEVKDRLVGGGKAITDKGWRAILAWAKAGISNATTAEAYQAKAQVLESENKALLQRVNRLQPYYEKIAPVLNSPYRPEFDDLERRVGNWSMEQKKGQEEAVEPLKRAYGEYDIPAPTKKKTKSHGFSL